MITLDDLTKDYRDEIAKPQYPGWGEKHRAGVRRVVERLRDELFPPYWQHRDFLPHEAEQVLRQILGDAGTMGPSEVDGREVSAPVAHLDGGTRDPLAPPPATDPIRDAVAMARGRVLVVDDIPTLNKLAAAMKPATDAAPAVCVWTETSIDPLGYAWLNSSCGLVDCHERDVLMQPDPQKHCPSCGKPIKFTEAK